jgi:hypothetical protein
LGDAMAKNAVQARLSASDLSQVPGGAQQINPKQLKFAEKVQIYDVAFKEDKWSKADKSPETFKYLARARVFKRRTIWPRWRVALGMLICRI